MTSKKLGSLSQSSSHNAYINIRVTKLRISVPVTVANLAVLHTSGELSLTSTEMTSESRCHFVSVSSILHCGNDSISMKLTSSRQNVFIQFLYSSKNAYIII